MALVLGNRSTAGFSKGCNHYLWTGFTGCIERHCVPPDFRIIFEFLVSNLPLYAGGRSFTRRRSSIFHRTLRTGSHTKMEA